MLGWTNKTPSLLHVFTFINIVFVSLHFHSPVSSLHSLFHLTPSSVTFNVIVTSAHLHRHSTHRHYHFHWSSLPFTFIVTSTRPINRVFQGLVHLVSRLAVIQRVRVSCVSLCCICGVRLRSLCLKRVYSTSCIWVWPLFLPSRYRCCLWWVVTERGWCSVCVRWTSVCVSGRCSLDISVWDFCVRRTSVCERFCGCWGAKLYLLGRATFPSSPPSAREWRNTRRTPPPGKNRGAKRSRWGESR